MEEWNWIEFEGDFNNFEITFSCFCFKSRMKQQQQQQKKLEEEEGKQRKKCEIFWMFRNKTKRERE